MMRRPMEASETARWRQAWREGAERRWKIAPFAIVAVACALAVGAGWNNSATSDEPYHTLAAFTYVRDGHGDLNPEHPPLTKLLAGLPLQALGLRGTRAPAVARLHVLTEEIRQFLYFNTRPALTILRTARVAMLPFLVLLVLGVWRWGCLVGGRSVALLATLAVASQPLVLGHAFVVHTDVAAAATFLAALLSLELWLAGRKRGWLPFGLWLGLALLTKFSAAYLVPLTAVRLLVHVLRTRRHRLLAGYVGAGALALAVLLAGSWPMLRKVSRGEEHATIAAYMALWPGSAVTMHRLQALADLSPALAHYGLGLAYVHYAGLHGHLNYFDGTVSAEGFPLYYPVAFALKTTLPFLALTLVGLLALARRRDSSSLVLASYALCYFLVVGASGYNIGARHLMPVIPLLALLGAQIASAWTPLLRGAVAASLALGALLPFPHYISHFSLLAGGPARGGRILSDSNVDWEQDWVRVARDAERNGWRPIAFVHAGAGFPESHLPGAVDFLASRSAVAPGYYAVAATTATTGTAYLRALRDQTEARRLEQLLVLLHTRGRLVATVGGSIAVYYLPELPVAEPPA
jgi:4-amino-4-deoxy-L-arabinose transferase-like glycosyltransferase